MEMLMALWSGLLLRILGYPETKRASFCLYDNYGGFHELLIAKGWTYITKETYT